MRSQRLRIVVTGLIAQHPTLGGVAWDYAAYPAALRRMGHDAYYLEDSGEWPYNLNGGPSGQDWVARDPSANLRRLAEVMERFDLGDRWAYRFPLADRWYGMSDARRGEVLGSADLLINVSGTLERPEQYRRATRLAYIDSDPVFTQIKWMLDDERGEFRRRVDAHDVHFTFGERLGASVPDTGHTWVPTRQPIVIDEWRTDGSYRDVYTTVMSWTSYQPLRYRSQTFAQKDVEFRRFVRLPGLVPSGTFEVALHATEHVSWESVDRSESEDGVPVEAAPVRVSAREQLTAAGWRVVDPHHACGDLDGYRAYVQTSKGEWSVAKNGYVAGNPGWFSCRSACYLAAGRPVIIQDTGIRDLFPAGEGLMVFTTLQEAIDAVADVEARYPTHARRAREIAHAYFAHEPVLNRLIADAMNPVTEPRRTRVIA